MKYMLLIQDSEREWAALGEAEVRQVMAEYRQFTEQIKTTGHFVGGAQLEPTTSATSVRVRNGKQLVTDGPYAETHEQLGGYYVIEARDLDEAIGIAARVPSARFGTIEIRPVVESPVVATY
ncbi:MAG: YciI family protein [Acidobacteriota bacterium]